TANPWPPRASATADRGGKVAPKSRPAPPGLQRNGHLLQDSIGQSTPEGRSGSTRGARSSPACSPAQDPHHPGPLLPPPPHPPHPEKRGSWRERIAEKGGTGQEATASKVRCAYLQYFHSAHSAPYQLHPFSQDPLFSR